MARVCRVIPDVPALSDRAFDYLVPDEMAGAVRVGTLVRVSLQGRRVGGWIEALDVEPEAPAERLRPLAKVSSAGPPADIVALAAWAAWRWAGPRSALLRAASAPNAVPPGDASAPSAHRSSAFDPSDDREVEAVAAEARRASRTVVEWPPASRMAELLRRLVAERGSTIVVVPDVQRVVLLTRHLERAGLVTVAMHADQSAAERTRAWAAARRGGAVVVGGRVAAWAPVPDLAAAVVVDEGDEAHKEERAPAWHARDLVLERARRAGSRVTFVTPAPTLEALATVARPRRPDRSRLREGWPVLTVVDRRNDPPGSGLFSPAFAELARRGAGTGRVVCVLNRKGRAGLLVCAACEQVVTCERCGAAVAEEEAGLRCRVCDLTRPRVCGECGSAVLRRVKPGVGRVREELAALLPRFDVGEVDANVEHVPETPIVVGTESVLHRVRRASVVAFLDFDMELLAPRYRGLEQAMWLLVRAARVVGPRSGRGTVVVQTRAPDHEVLVAAAAGAIDGFAEGERERRRALRLPPFTALAAVSGELGAMEVLAEEAREAGVEVLGPTLVGRTHQALVRAADTRRLCDALALAVPKARAFGRLRVDVDPLRA